MSNLNLNKKSLITLFTMGAFLLAFDKEAAATDAIGDYLATGMFYNIVHREQSIPRTCCLDANGTDIYFNETDINNGYQQWQIDSVPDDGWFKIRHRASGRYITAETLEGGGRVFFDDHRDSGHQLWNIAIRSDGWWNIQHRSTRGFLSKKGREIFLTGEANSNHEKWNFCSPWNELRSTIENFNYEKPILNLAAYAKPEVVIAASSLNNGTESVKDRIRILRKYTNSSSFSFSETHEREFFNRLEVDVKAEISYMGIFGPGMGQFEGGIGVHNTTEWRNRDTSLTCTQTVNVNSTEVCRETEYVTPPGTKVDFLVTWNAVDLDIPFTARVKTIGFAEGFGRDRDVAISADAVAAIMKCRGYNGNIEGRNGKTVVSTISGTVHVKGAVSGTTTTHEKPI